jgi:hypothetical protein
MRIWAAAWAAAIAITRMCSAQRLLRNKGCVQREARFYRNIMPHSSGIAPCVQSNNQINQSIKWEELKLASCWRCGLHSRTKMLTKSAQGR